LSTAETEWGLGIDVSFWYNRTDVSPYVGVETPNATYEVWNTKDQVIMSGSLISLGGGKYRLVLNSTDVVAANVSDPSLGTYRVYVYFNRTHFVSQTLIITWTIVDVRIACYATATNVSLIWSESTTIGIYYNRTRDWVFISGASYSMVIYDENYTDITSSIPSEAFVISEGVGVYLLDINSSYLSVAMYILEITFSKQYHEDGVITIFVDVQPIKAYAVPNVKSASVEYPENFTFKVWYYTESYNITDANATYVMEYGGVPIDTGNLTFNATDKSYELFISSRDAFNKSGASDLPITLTIYVHLRREYHESKTLILALTIEPIKTKLTLSEKSATLRYGQVWIFYMNYTDIDGVTSLYDANTEYNISCNGTLITSGTIPHNLTNGWYEFYLEFDTIDILNKTLEKIDITLPTVYEIRVWFGKKFYQKQSAVLSVTVNPMETMLDVSATSVSIKYGESWLFNFSYIDIATSQMILNATTYFEIRHGAEILQNGSLLYNATHNYYLIFNSTDIDMLGSFALYVYFWKRFYEKREKIISVTIEARDTYIVANATSVTLEYGEVCYFDLSYIDAETLTNIVGANATYIITFNGSDIYYGNLTYNPTLESYILMFDSRQVVNLLSPPALGTYVITVSFGKRFYMNVTKVLSVTVTPIRTFAYAQPKNITVIWGQAPEVDIYYVVTKNGSIIKDASVTIEVTPEAPEGAFRVEFSIAENRYKLYVNSSLLSIKAYYLVNITLSKQFCESKVVVVKVNVKPIPTYLMLSQKTFEIEYGDMVELEAWYKVYGTGEDIEYANATYVVYYEEYELLSGNFTYNPQTRTYIFSINSTDLVDVLTQILNVEYLDLPITLTVEVSFSKSVYLEQPETIAITIYDISCSVRVSEEEITAEWGEPVDITIEVLRAKTLEYVTSVKMDVCGIGEDVYTVENISTGLILHLDTSQLDLKTYRVTLNFAKPYHYIPEMVLTITVKEVSVSVGFAESPPKEVTKLQLIEEHKTTEIKVLVTHRNMPVEDAEVKVKVMSRQAGVTKEYKAEKTGIPGVFSVKIDWADYPPGYKWVVEVTIEKVKVYGKWVASDKLSYKVLEHEIRMDYVSGSTEITVPIINKKIYMANMFFYPMVILMLVGIAYGGYRFWSWWTLPWEVKEISKILKLIEKGIFEYPVPDRREYLMEMVASELGIES